MLIVFFLFFCIKKGAALSVGFNMSIILVLQYVFMIRNKVQSLNVKFLQKHPGTRIKCDVEITETMILMIIVLFGRFKFN